MDAGETVSQAMSGSYHDNLWVSVLRNHNFREILIVVLLNEQSEREYLWLYHVQYIIV